MLEAEFIIIFFQALKIWQKYVSSVKKSTESEYVLEIRLSSILGAVERFVCAQKCSPSDPRRLCIRLIEFGKTSLFTVYPYKPESMYLVTKLGGHHRLNYAN